MINTKVAFVISMFDEYEVVLKTLLTINKQYKDPTIILVSSDDGRRDKREKLKLLATKSLVLPNLYPKYHHYYLPSYAVTRNFSAGFSLINEDVDYIIALLGDTLIYNAESIHKKALIMIKEDKYLCCCKAYGQYFNSKKSKKEKVIVDRYQGEDTTDFLPALFVVSGKVFKKTKMFTNIRVTNKFTSEQCLGDETIKYFSKKQILEKTIILNSNNPSFCYAFTEGIKYHAVTGKPGR